MALCEVCTFHKIMRQDRFILNKNITENIVLLFTPFWVKMFSAVKRTGAQSKFNPKMKFCEGIFNRVINDKYGIWLSLAEK